MSGILFIIYKEIGSFYKLTNTLSYELVTILKMNSIALIKQEEQSIPLHFYTIISTSPSPEPRWTPNHHTPLAKPTFIQQSSSCYPEVPVAKVVRGISKYGHSSNLESYEPPPIRSSPIVPLSVEAPITLPAPLSPTSTTSESSTARIPRPPNAFMLFRSDFLKRGVIPSNVECRQQNLSRVIGEVWNMMDDAEREKWNERAKIASKEHKRKNPGYKFTPAPRGSRRNRSRSRGDPISDKPNNTRDLREKYANIMGPSPPSVRKRRQQRTCEKQTEKQASMPPLFTSFSFSPPSTKPHDVIRIDQSLPYYSMMTLPEPTIPRRPSTSLGFHPPPKRNDTSWGSPDLRFSSTRPPSTVSSTSGFLDNVRVDRADSPAFFASFGFTDEVIPNLTSTTQVPLLGDFTNQMWLPSGSLNFEDWDLNVYPDNNVVEFTVGDL